LLKQSIFVDPPDKGARLWAMDLSLRCSAVAAVIADGRRFDISATRRLQLAAESANALGLVARPVGDFRYLSAATTRWRVSHAPSPNQKPRMRIELARCKSIAIFMGGTHQGGKLAPTGSGTGNGQSSWTLQWDRQAGAVVVPVAVSTDVADRSGEASMEPGAQGKSGALRGTGPEAGRGRKQRTA